ncbi:hypothetical protein A3I40_04315 [Candidatus Uhrbacteria bacterium RIFCSPLOWO2_02_FULL_48_12]|uniref:Uncharacterized protein n=1 Tax=Candidatus Uhrbacteria bacterium RIFCSPLOWO2_02_FULL_48_12 TaxID=1802407 RepID=A0A1F7VAK1_9BACT|nr:MAG: hypothetical protein A3I40_04315 [Candidatus Uhrbacteria bacterium RIFCSPLOWO2_02_FULL_48_12]
MRYKLFITFLLILSIAGVALLGFTMVEHGMGHEAGGCLAQVGRVAPCPESGGSSPADFLTFHLEVLKIFSVAPDFLNVIAALLLMLILVALRRLKFLRRGIMLSVGHLMAAGYTSIEQFVTPLETNLRQWLAMHEKRDPITVLWAPWSSQGYNLEC